MRSIIKKIASICKMVTGYGIMICLFVGGLTFFGYVVALIVGGDPAAAICMFLYMQVIPVMIYVNAVMILLGLLSMYLAGETALTSSNKEKKK